MSGADGGQGGFSRGIRVSAWEADTLRLATGLAKNLRVFVFCEAVLVPAEVNRFYELGTEAVTGCSWIFAQAVNWDRMVSTEPWGRVWSAMNRF